MRDDAVLKRKLSVLMLSLALSATALVSVSCGKNSEKADLPEGEEAPVVVEIRSAEDIDELIRELDADMDSLSDQDFAPDQLNEGKLGW